MHGNYKNYTKDQVEGAILARKLQAMLGHLTDDKFKLMVSLGSPRNCDVKVLDVSNTNASVVFWPVSPRTNSYLVIYSGEAKKAAHAP